MDIEDSEMMVPSLWGDHVTDSKPVPLEPHDQRFTLYRATLESGNKAQIFISIKGTKYALGTLEKGKKEYTKLEIEIFEGTDEISEISVVGDGTVALVGAFTPALFNEGLDEEDFGSLSDFDDDDDEEDLPQLLESKRPSIKGPPGKGAPGPKGPQQPGNKPPAKGQQPGAGNKPPTGQPQQPAGKKNPPGKPAAGNNKPGGQPQQQPKTPPKAAGGNKSESSSPKQPAEIKKEEPEPKTPEKAITSDSAPGTSEEEKTEKSEGDDAGMEGLEEKKTTPWKGKESRRPTTTKNTSSQKT